MRKVPWVVVVAVLAALAIGILVWSVIGGLKNPFENLGAPAPQKVNK